MPDIETLFRSYHREIYLYIYSLSGDSATADDIAAETFLKAFAAIRGFRGESSIRTWLYQIAKNTYYSHIRINQRYVLTGTFPIQQAYDDASSALLAAEVLQAVDAALNNLSSTYREVFALRVFGELGFVQIGQLFGKTANWACVTYHRARTRIREEMEDF